MLKTVAQKRMIKIFIGGRGTVVVTPSRYLPPYDQFLPLPIHPFFSCFRRDSLMTYHRPASNIFHCCPRYSSTTSALPPLPPNRFDCTRTRNFPSCPVFFSNLEYDYHVSLRNSLLNGDNLQYDKPTIRKIHSYRFYVCYKKL